MATNQKVALHEKLWLSICLAFAVLVGCEVMKGPSARPVTAPKTEGAVVCWDFEGEPTGKLPMGWSMQETNPGKTPATWKIAKDETAPSGQHVLALTRSDNVKSTYNLAIADKTSFKDLDLTVKVRAVEGKEDQGGGPIWRCRDKDNYYICRFNPLEKNFRIYFVNDSKRKQLQSCDIETKAGNWYTVRVTMIGEDITCYLDGRKLLEVKDATFKEAGAVGLWTKADAVTSFDDLKVK